MIDRRPGLCPWAALVWVVDGGVHRGQIIDQLALRVAVAIDVPLGCLDRPGGGGKDEEASCLLIGDYCCLFSTGVQARRAI